MGSDLYHQHPDRKEERCFLPYKPPPEDGTSALVEEFLELAQLISEDLEWLLALPHDKFWCQVRISHPQTLLIALGFLNHFFFVVLSLFQFLPIIRWCLMSLYRGVWTLISGTLLVDWTRLVSRLRQL